MHASKFFFCYQKFFLNYNCRYGRTRVDVGSPLKKQSNSKEEPVKEEITNNSSGLLQTVKKLKIEMETVKKENERILRAQEELNQILMDKFQSEGKDK